MIFSALLVCGIRAEAAHTRARLILGAETAKPGATLLAGVLLQMDPNWHTYWQNSGASGAPTTIEWTLPKGMDAGRIQWPVPEKLSDEDLTTYIYSNQVLLIVPMKLAAELTPGPLTIKAKVDWLECEALCRKGSANLEATLIVGSENKPSADAALLAAWQKKLPQNSDKISPRAWWESRSTNNIRPLIIEWQGAAAVSSADFFPDASEDWEVQPATARPEFAKGKIRLRKVIKKFSGGWPVTISGVMVEGSGEARSGYEVTLRVAEAPDQASRSSK